MSNLSDIRGALASQLVARMGEVHVYNHANDAPVAPCVMIMPPELIDYRESFTAGMKRYVLPLQLRVQRVQAEVAEDALDELIDSLFDAIDFDHTLSGVIDSALLYQADTFGLATQDDAPLEYLACVCHLELLVTSL